MIIEAAWFCAFGGLINAHWICYINPVFRIFDYIIGISLGVVFKYRSSSKNFSSSYKNTILEIVTLIVLFAVLPLKFIFGHEFYRLLYTIFAAFSIYVFALESGKLSAFFSVPVLNKASNQSLNWYLMHQIVIHAVMIVFSSEWICFFATVFLVSAGCYIWSFIMKRFNKLKTVRKA